jgi:hypothetical protein
MTNKVNLHIVYYSEKGTEGISFMSKTNQKGEIIVHNFINDNFSYELKRMEPDELLSELIHRGKIDINPDDVVALSFLQGTNIISYMPDILFNKEYQYNLKPQFNSTFKSMTFNTSRIHKDIYEFSDMIQSINNHQFTLELEECLEAYEKEKFFICAAGLGSVLEHLLYLSIEKHVDEKDIKINENSTASEYIGQLKKEPFKIDKREASHLKNIFAYRNSVSHFNKGIFSKEMCDHLLSGIKISFDKYYLFNQAN